MELTESRNLRGGRSSWIAGEHNTLAGDTLPERADVVVIGAGVMGAMIADKLADADRRVVLIDRRPPAHGSTAASTALVMWGADVPLTHLSQSIGMDQAARRWRRVYAAIGRLARHLDAIGLDCGRIDRPELYLSGTLLDDTALRAEGAARQAAGLPSTYLDADAIASRFGIAPRAALLSQGCYEVDPVRLTLGLLERARQRNARVCFPVDATGIEATGDGIRVRTACGREIAAGQVVVASGYERARWFLPDAFGIISSYAIATPPGIAPKWRENAMIWEASPGYIYARATADGRIIAGGEDEDFDDGQRRDALIGEKGGTIRAKLAAMVDIDMRDIPVDCAWAAAFGSSPDGLPAIGRAVNHDRLWLASGFGGNGVTFAALGAELLAAELGGAPDPDAACFDPYRFEHN